MELATLYPDRITVRECPDYRFGDAASNVFAKFKGKNDKKQFLTVNCKEQALDLFGSTTTTTTTRTYSINSKNNLKVKKSTFKLSDTSRRLIRDSYQLLYELSPPRTVKVNLNTSIFNFRTTFITLTLPSAQIHSDVEIKKCLNLFLNNIRRQLKVNNYVWKAELQKNENIHFHLTVDVFCSYNSLRFYWNKAINTLGYVDRYSTKFSQMSLSDYAKYRRAKVEEVREAYAKGKSNNWTKPNSVDVKPVRNDKSLKSYLAKYLSKNNDDLQDVSRASKFGKTWSRSQSLSKIKLIKRWLWQDFKDIIGEHLSDVKQFYKSSNDYCTVFYFSFSQLHKDIKSILFGILKRQAVYYDYVFPT
jgi:hypothetical protein